MPVFGTTAWFYWHHLRKMLPKWWISGALTESSPSETLQQPNLLLLYDLLVYFVYTFIEITK